MTPSQPGMFATPTSFCEPRLPLNSIYAFLHRECRTLFPDQMFADLFTDIGRRSVPPMIVAVVMVLQRLEGCSDREAVQRFTYDARWKYAAGGLDFDYPGFVHTVLVDMRARLAASEDPDRIFAVVLQTARQAGLVGRRRVLDSTPIYDAVATMDTVTLVRSAIRRLLAACDAGLEGELRALLGRDDDYRDAGKPVCDYEDRQAREELVDALARDARALICALDGRELPDELAQTAALLASVVGQDLDEGEDGIFRIARRVAKDRIISIVDPDARHGHKTSARGFDGFKGHVSVDPDSEIIVATAVTAGNIGDAAPAGELLADDLPTRTADTADTADTAEEMIAETVPDRDAVAGERLSVYGDCAYGTGGLLCMLQHADAEIYCKVQAPNAPGGLFPKSAFGVDLDAGTVSCPAGHTVTLTPAGDGQHAKFAGLCASCPLAAQCTTAAGGRTISVGPYERQLARARARQHDPDWKAGYTATRPKVERKIGHLMRRKHGGRRARVRGTPKVGADFSLLAAATNLARLAVLGLTAQHGDWVASAT